MNGSRMGFTEAEALAPAGQARRPPAVAGEIGPAMPDGPGGAMPATVIARMQAQAGNRAVQRLLADASVQRCGPVPCDCSPEERAAAERTPRPASNPA